MPDRAIAGAAVQRDELPLFALNRKLTGREIEALRLAARGLTSREMALTLFIAERTVKQYLAAAREKLGAINTTHAVAIALARRLISIENF
jgi:DNA-binding CsgD family transcriptional regulator